MKLAFSFFFLLNIFFGYSQDSIPIHKRFPSVPPFSLLKYPDSSRFMKDDLPKKKAVMVIIFSPDCDHCHMATRDLIKNMEKFEKVQIVMVTALEFKYIQPFYKEFQMENFPNVIVARDPSFFLGTYYSVKNFPSVYLYDKKGKLIAESEGHADFIELAGEL